MNNFRQVYKKLKIFLKKKILGNSNDQQCYHFVKLTLNHKCRLVLDSVPLTYE